MKTRKLISALISIAMVISMLPMTLASAADITVSKVVSAGKPVKVYTDKGTEHKNQAYLTDGDINGQVDWIYTQTKPITIDLEASYLVSNIEITRVTQFGEANNPLSFYVSDNEYTTTAEVVANAELIGQTETAANGRSTVTVPVTPASGRYVYALENAASYQRINEITVYAYVSNVADISGTETTALDLLNYKEEFAAAYGLDEANIPTSTEWNPRITGIFKNEWLVAMGDEGNTHTMQIPVTFAQSGAYKIELLAGAGTNSQAFPHFDVYLTNAEGTAADFGGQVIQNWEYNKNDNSWVSCNGSSHASNAIGYTAKTGVAYVNAGTYNLNLGITSAKRMFLKTLSVVPCDIAEISAEGETYIEAETFMPDVATITPEVAHGGTAVYEEWGYAGGEATISYNLPINISEAGEYDITTLMHAADGFTTSQITVKVDGTELYKNGHSNGTWKSNDYVPGSDGNSSFPGVEYAGTVELDADVHNIEFVIARTANEWNNGAGEAIYKILMDYVKIAKKVEAPQNSISEAEGVTTINVYYEAAPANVFAVFYNGDAIADIAKGTITDASATITATITEAEYTSVKVFAWNDRMVPQADVVNF